MKKIKRIFIALIVIVVIFFIFKGCHLNAKYLIPPQITIINNSTLELKDITLSGSGFTEKVGNLIPGGSMNTVVHPRGESGLEISFTAKSERYQKDDLAYIESTGGYIVKLIIDESLDIKSECKFGLDIK